MLNETTHDHDSDPPPPSGPMPGRLSKEERVRRAELLEQATRKREAHALDKAAWTKVWKRKDEYFAELMARLTREAGTGIDEGRQLTIPETDDAPASAPSDAPIEVLTGRWAELARIDPPRITAWTLQEADLSPVASKLLELLKPRQDGERIRKVSLKRADLPELLDCSPSEALDALAELLCFDLAELHGDKEVTSNGVQDDLLRLDHLGFNDHEDPARAVLEAMLHPEASIDDLSLEVKLPRRVLLPLLAGLVALGAVTKEAGGWRRVARVPLWERLVLDVLARGDGREYLAKRALVGCIDVTWTVSGLIEAGVLVSGKSGAGTGEVWQIVDEADREPLSPDEVKTRVKRETPEQSPVSLERLSRDVGLQAPTVRRACEALAADGWLAQAKTPKGYVGETYFGPWYERAEEAKSKKKAPARKEAPKAKAQPKKASNSEKSKTAPKVSKEEEPEAPSASLLPPAPPAKGHPQRVLRSWIYARLGSSGSMSLDQLCAEAPAFHREYLTGTLRLLLACELVMEWGHEEETFAAVEHLPGRTIDQLVLDAVADALSGEGLTVADLAGAMSVQVAVVWDILEELREQGRVAQYKDRWTLVAGSAQDRTEALFEGVEPAPAREEAVH